MAVGINRVVLVGNLTQDPELRHTQGGTPVCGLSLAVNGREKVGEQWQDRADFFEIRVWGNQGERCNEHLRKGSQVGVSGKLRLEKWGEGESKKSRIIVVADDVQFLARWGRDAGERSAAFVPDADFAVPEGDFSTGGGDFLPTGSAPDDDIPF